MFGIVACQHRQDSPVIFIIIRVLEAARFVSFTGRATANSHWKVFGLASDAAAVMHFVTEHVGHEYRHKALARLDQLGA